MRRRSITQQHRAAWSDAGCIREIEQHLSNNQCRTQKEWERIKEQAVEVRLALSPNDAEMVHHCGHRLWRLRRIIYLAPRLFQYFPERRRSAPSAVGLTKAEEVVVDTADGERVIVWHVPPCGVQPVFVYFHGNGGSLRWREERFCDLIDDGSGLVALSYRGYGGSSGHPTEKGLIEDPKAAYAFSVARYPAERLVLWGKSLGSALALSLGSRKPGRASRAGSSFYFGRRRRRAAYWIVPVRLLMKEPVSLGFAR